MSGWAVKVWAQGRLVAGLALLAALAPVPAHAARVASVSPQGEVAQVRQLLVRFDAAVVPFGEPRLPDAMAVACEGGTPPGSGRWIDARQWAFDFRQPLPPGSRCSVQPRSDWQPLGGALSGTTTFNFSTGGPAVVRIWPYEGSQIEEDQHFLLGLSGPVVEASLAGHAGCEVEGLGERVAVRVVVGTARDAVIQARGLVKQADRLLLLACQRPLPPGAAVRLVWGAGIAAAANPTVVTSAVTSFRYTVRPAFTAEFSCERERANAPCLPVRPLSLRFSEPVARALAQQVRLKPASGAALAPVFDKDDTATEVSAVTFPKPLSDNTRFTIELPPGLKDGAGRPLANAASFPLAVATGEAPPIAKFSAAPFGVIEWGDQAVLPVTLRHVQGDLRPAAPGGQLRVRRLDAPADILAWLGRLQRFHDTRLTAREAGLPEADWTVAEPYTDAQGRPRQRRVDRLVATRELSLLKADPAAQRLDLPTLQGGDPRPFEVVGIPLREPGYHVVEIESRRLGQSLLASAQPMYVRTGVLVTNLGLHFKHGRESSLAWVTTLDRGRPVAKAQVVVHDCRGRPLWRGQTDASGQARIAQALDEGGAGGGDGGDSAAGVAGAARCIAEPGLFVTARVEAGASGASSPADQAFVFSSWQKGIEGWRFNLPTDHQPEAGLRAHTVMDRTLLRVGETVSMKHFVRTETTQGLAAVPPGSLPTLLKIVHLGSGQVFSQPLQWPGGRSATSTWAIPAAARLGLYRVVLQRDGGDPRQRNEWDSGEFRVEAFRLPLVDARIVPPQAAPVAPQSLALDVRMAWLSGGAMAQLPLAGSALLKARALQFAGYEGFSFAPPQALEAPAVESDEATDRESAADQGRLVADQQALTTDRDGAARWLIAGLPKISRASALTAEIRFNDPNGEVQTVATTVPLWPSAVVLGVRSAGWARQPGAVDVQVLALDTHGKPISGQAVALHGLQTQTLSTRKRLVGGFYAYDNRIERKDLGLLCSGRTDAQGLLACQTTLAAAGQIELVAKAQDGAGNASEAAASLWVTKQGELWFAQGNDDRIDVLPDKRRYEPGDTARFQVRMPFRQATALVTVEREGVIDTRVVTLRGDDPTVELKIDKAWGPNVYVSVLAVRGRIRELPWYSFFQWGWKEPLGWARSFWYDGAQYQAPTAMVDLAKPAFRLGVAAIQVGLAAHQLDVVVSTDRPQYAIRQQVQARIRVSQGGQPVAGAEVAFAVVDESLLVLRGNDSWDLLNAMLRERAWGVQTSTAQGEIIGRRHFGRKAVAAGGGGGAGGTRELFDTLLLWQPRVRLDAKGEATVTVPLNDSLTRFRLVAVADAGLQTFGTGAASIRVTQDLQLLAGLPPLVREGDRYLALLTLRNTTAREMKLRASLTGTASGPPGATPVPPRVAPLDAPLVLPPQDLVLAAGAAREISWPVDVPAAAERIQWQAVVVEAGTGGASDRVSLSQTVAPAVPIRVLQATLQPLDGRFTMPVAAPADALPLSGPPPAPPSGSGPGGPAVGPAGGPAGGPSALKRGGLLVAVQPRLTGALPGIRRYFETYPFSGLEAQASKALGLRDAGLWAAVANTLPTYLDSDGLASHFAPAPGEAAQGSDRLTAYLLAASHEAGVALPATARDAMLAGLTAFVQGRIQRSVWSPRPDLDVRKLAAIAALARHGRAQPRLLGSLNLRPQQWPTAAVIDWLTILQRVEGMPDRQQRLATAQQVLRSRLAWAGTTLTFSNEADDQGWRLMDNADANASRLILALLDDPAWRAELPRLVVGSLGRQRQGAWSTTTANLWGVLALDKFSAQFEAAAVTGRTVASTAPALAAPAAGAGVGVGVGVVPGVGQAIDWALTPQGGRLMLPWPASAGTLNVAQQGSGQPWLTVQSLAAIPLAAPIRAGYTISRSVSAVQRKDPAAWSRGDVLRVRLQIDALADMSWVVVSDPVPAGATILGSGLGRDSAIALRGERAERPAGSAWPAFEERGVDTMRQYFAFMPRGPQVIEYTLRLNNPGRFQLPPSRVEAMYAPDQFGESPNAPLDVKP